MSNYAKLAADTSQKLGLGFTIAAFVQADNALEVAMLGSLAVTFLAAAFWFTQDD